MRSWVKQLSDNLAISSFTWKYKDGTEEIIPIQILEPAAVYGRTPILFKKDEKIHWNYNGGYTDSDTLIFLGRPIEKDFGLKMFRKLLELIE